MSKKKAKRPIHVEIRTNDLRYATGIVKKTVLNRGKHNIQVSIEHPKLNQFQKLSDVEDESTGNHGWVKSVFTGKFDKKLELSKENMPDIFETQYESETLFVMAQPDENEKFYKRLLKLFK